MTSETEACIIFVDIINSSSFSSFTCPDEYAKWIILFQDTFQKLANKYFQKNDDDNDNKSLINVAGDEGYIFYPKWMFSRPYADISAIYKAICFALEFKTQIKLLPHIYSEENDFKLMPHGLKIAVGIHYGNVNYTENTENENGRSRSIVDKYIGYNINYAKRIETCSREGRFSNIFISKEAYKIIKFKKAIFFEHHLVELKGIEKAIDAYEIKSVFINDDYVKDLMEEKWSKYLIDIESSILKKIIEHEYWFKSYYLSIIFQFHQKAQGPSNKQHYEKLFLNELFSSIEVDDPVVQFIQALEYDKKGDLTLSIGKLKRVLKKYPEFIYAKIYLLDLLLKLHKNPNNKKVEIIYLVDSIKELLKYFYLHFTEEEKSELKRIQSEAENMDLPCQHSDM